MQPFMTSIRTAYFDGIVPPASLLFQLPALALAGGLTLISLFVIRTDAAIARKKALAAKAK
jgi:hypothetical protein